MRVTDADFHSPVFKDHPAGWRSPADLVDAFTLAWALELQARVRLSPHAPFDEGIRDRLPAKYRFDTLGRLVEMWPGASGADFSASAVVRLTTMCGAWQLFDLMNQNWRIRAWDYLQFAEILAYVTGGRERPSLYHDLSANLSKCLLAVRVRRAYAEQDHLDRSEEWFLTGDSDLLDKDTVWAGSLAFDFGGHMVSVPLVAHEVVDTVWATARVTVDEIGYERVIDMHHSRIEQLSDLLVRGSEKALKAQQELPANQFRFFNIWPGWS